MKKNNQEVTLQKKRLRKMMLKRRNSLSPASIENKSKLIVKKLLAWPVLQEAKTIFCYVSTPQEVATHDLISQLLNQGKTVVVPKIIGQGRMKPVKVESLEDLVKDKYEILAPVSDEPFKQPIELNLMPAVAVDLAGHRLGMGGGFYDRFIELYQPKLNTALVFSDQILDFVPTTSSDKLVKVVVTERKIHELASSK